MAPPATKEAAGQAVLDPELDPAFDILEPEELTSPLVFSSPHSGSVYPASFIAMSRLDPLALRRSEDAWVDELFMPALRVGAPMIRARFPRAYLDLNREPYELDPRMFEGRLPSAANTRSVRVAGGLGTIARVVGESHEIYRGRLPVSEALRRIEGLYKPYHRALRGLIERAWERFGMALLVDCHSMPSTQALAWPLREEERMRADFIVGDRYGTSCDTLFSADIEQTLIRLGFNVRRNKPYAGGFITEHYGSPSLGVHAIQIEVNRALYMNESTMEKHSGFDALTEDIDIVCRELAATARNFLLSPGAAAE